METDIHLNQLISLVLLIVVVLFSSISVEKATDEMALLSFKSSITEDPSGALSSWGVNDSLHYCQWPGVSCNDMRVTQIVLPNLNLSGTISPALGNLTFLTNISLSNNFFHGEIPSALTRCSRLERLVLWGNYLHGGIPTGHNLSCFPNLVGMDLSVNQLTGPIPPYLGFSLSSFEQLILFGNNLSGTIPDSLGNASSSLFWLDLHENNLTGPIPPSLGTLSYLALLDLSFNGLDGETPPSIWNLSALEYLMLAYNQLSGQLPTSLAFPKLAKFLIYFNQFSGPIPASLSNSSGLQLIELNNNKFSGTIPSSLGSLKVLRKLLLENNMLRAKTAADWSFLDSLSNCTQLKTLQLDQNLLTGTLPRSLTNLSTSLLWLSLSYNQISGTIPSEIENLRNLSMLDMSYNLLSGTIPPSTARLSQLSHLDFSHNRRITGTIPSTIGNLTQLTELYLTSDLLTGSIPTAIGECQYLVALDLSHNKLTGGIPIQVLGISALSNVNLAGNSLTGPLPSEIEGLSNLVHFDASMNNLSGEIPSSLGRCGTLEYLFMEGNLFEGVVPPTLGNLKSLLELDLSRNRLSGEIPVFFEKLPHLYHLNLSFNNFTGEIPKEGVFGNLTGISVVGNYKLCGGLSKLSLPPCSIIKPPLSNKKKNLVIRAIVIAACILSFVTIICLIGIAYRIRRSRIKTPATEIIRDPHMKVISYAELVKATDGFDQRNLIGVGSFGSVYKGIMDYNGTSRVVAVKVIQLHDQKASKSFMAECKALRNVRHRNLVKSLTSCSTIDFQGNDFKALVFDYMPNGSLDDWLHPEQGETKTKSLSLLQRLNIAIDVASALDYLHHQGQIPIVHCDLKPSNVLLDEDMTGHVADFGLARFIMESITNSSSTQSISVGLKGTIGYIPPEYGMGNKVWVVGDVYSYGILVLEMFTGRRPTDECFKDGSSLHKVVDMAVLLDQAMDVVDQSLLAVDDVGTTADERKVDLRGRSTAECIVSVLRIGLNCSKEMPSERMQIGDVVKEIQAIRDVLFLETRRAVKLRDEGQANPLLG